MFQSTKHLIIMSRGIQFSEDQISEFQVRPYNKEFMSSSFCFPLECFSKQRYVLQIFVLHQKTSFPNRMFKMKNIPFVHYILPYITYVYGSYVYYCLRTCTLNSDSLTNNHLPNFYLISILLKFACCSGSLPSVRPEGRWQDPS